MLESQDVERKENQEFEASLSCMRPPSQKKIAIITVPTLRAAGKIKHKGAGKLATCVRTCARVLLFEGEGTCSRFYEWRTFVCRVLRACELLEETDVVISALEGSPFSVGEDWTVTRCLLNVSESPSPYLWEGMHALCLLEVPLERSHVQRSLSKASLAFRLVVTSAQHSRLVAHNRLQLQRGQRPYPPWKPAHTLSHACAYVHIVKEKKVQEVFMKNRVKIKN